MSHGLRFPADCAIQSQSSHIAAQLDVIVVDIAKAEGVHPFERRESLSL